MCGPKFCSMKITEEVRELAAQRDGVAASEVDAGLAAKAAEFRAGGQQLYVKTDR
jgi:phosphomethylpyrimidine synthase